MQLIFRRLLVHTLVWLQGTYTQQKLLSSPCFGAPKAYIPNSIPLRRTVFFTDTSRRIGGGGTRGRSDPRGGQRDTAQKARRLIHIPLYWPGLRWEKTSKLRRTRRFVHR